MSHSPPGSRFTEGLGERNSSSLFGSAPRAVTQVMLQGPSSAANLQGLLPNSPRWQEIQSFERGNLAVTVDPSERRCSFLCQSLQVFPWENRVGKRQVFSFLQWFLFSILNSWMDKVSFFCDACGQWTTICFLTAWPSSRQLHDCCAGFFHFAGFFVVSCQISEANLLTLLPNRALLC